MNDLEIAKNVQSAAQEIAPFIPGARYCPPEEGRHSWLARFGAIMLATGGTIHIGISNQHPGKYHISGCWPRTKKQQVIAPHDYVSISERINATLDINVSASRSREVIAKEIVRRLLPDYTRIYAAMCERRDAMDNEDELQRMNVNVLAKAGRVEANHDGTGFTIYNGPVSKVWASVEVSSDRAKMEIRSLPIHLAKMILELIANEK